jgi:hypothetical protein
MSHGFFQNATRPGANKNVVIIDEQDRAFRSLRD